MKTSNLIILLLIAIIGGFAFFTYNQSKQTKEEITPPPIAAVPDEPIKKPIVHYPVPQPAAPTPPIPEKTAQVPKQNPPLPAEPSFPESVDEGLLKMLGGPEIVKLFNLENFIQRLVLLVDNLPEKSIPRTYLPIKPPGGRFLISGTDQEPQTSSRNHKRYQAYVKTLESLDPDLVINFYIHFYPLFQKAYEQLGYQNAYFNDRLIFVLDHLLETPSPKEPIALEQPSVLYTYQDPLLENRSAGQKILIRIGPENRVKIMNLLSIYHRELRDLHP